MLYEVITKAIWSTFPWILMWIGLTCFFSLLFISADKSAERTKQLATLEAENAMYESANARLDEEIDWLRSVITSYSIHYTKLYETIEGQ